MSEPLRLLIVEDSESDEKLVLHALRRSGLTVVSERVEDEPAMREALARTLWDVVVSDWAMPRFSGPAALEVLKSAGLDIPFILVSGTIGEEVAVEAMRGGAADFMGKDRLARLAPAIARAMADARERRARREAELALRANEELFRQIARTIDDVLWVADVPGRRLRYVSPAFMRIWGRSLPPLDDLLRVWNDSIHPEDRERVTGQNAGPGTQGAWDETYRIRRPDGSWRWIRDRAYPIVETDGSVGRVIGLAQDVTAQKESASALRRSEARFARLAESGIIGIALANLHGDVHDANDAYLAMLGCDREDLAAGRMRWADMTPEEAEPITSAALAQLLATGVAAPWEQELFRKDGSRVPVLIGVAMLDHPDCVAFVLDLSKRKLAEAALRRSEEQLRQAQKMEAVGRLAGGVAHDFNNLLSVILGYAELARRDVRPGDPLSTALDQIQAAGDRAAGLTRQLLAFSRRQVLQPRVLDLNDVLSGMESLLRRLIGEDVSLSLALSPALRRVRVDPGQIEQVVMNLAVNARDAMPQGGSLTIETAEVVLDERYAAEHPGVTAGPHVMLSVSDTGCGMDAATKARIFEPFFTTKGPGKGTGLGLSTVFGIVEQSGASIWVYSEVGVGTTFKIYFPPAAGTAEWTSNVRADPDRGTPRGTETILLVEDDVPLRAFEVDVLRRLGYRVIEAQSGGDALLLADRHPGPIALLVTDVVMPLMSGRELAERLAPRRPEMRVLYMSGYTDDAVIRHGVLESNAAFLQKPIVGETLARAVRNVLDAPPRP